MNSVVRDRFQHLSSGICSLCPYGSVVSANESDDIELLHNHTSPDDSTAYVTETYHPILPNNLIAVALPCLSNVSQMHKVDQLGELAGMSDPKGGCRLHIRF